MDTPLAAALFEHLGEGQTWELATLQQRLNQPAAAIESAIQHLEEMGLAVRRAAGQVWLAHPAAPLDASRICAQLTPTVRRVVGAVEVAFSIPSTNAALMAGELGNACLLAEHQSAGRGRKGRVWQSPLGANVYLSVRHVFDREVRPSGCLALAVGQALAGRLESMGVAAGVKWPNDIYVGKRKLAGVLIESRLDSAQRWRVVIGVGVNYDLPPAVHDAPGIRATDLLTAMPEGSTCSRNGLAAAAITAVAEACERFAVSGAEAVCDDWPRWDAFPGAEVMVSGPGGVEQTGRAVGIDMDGRLLVRTMEADLAVSAGDVQYRTLMDVDTRRG